MPRTLVSILSSLLLITSPMIDSKGGRSFDDISQVFAFGDSYTFIQGTAGLANFSYIGDLLNFTFTAETLLTDQIIPKNTSSDGSNWIEFLTGCFEGLPQACPVELWDFAYAGADISADLLPLHHNHTVPLTDQVRQFIDNNVLSIVPKKPSNRRLIVWWIGINDTGDILGRNVTSLTEFWAREMEAYFAAVESVHAAGLRGTYLFLNVPPEDRSPANIGSASQAAAAKESIAGFNAALQSSITQFSTTHLDIHVSSFDAHAWFTSALDRADTLGFTNTTGFCECADPSFFWFNTGHPTERVHRLLADSIRAHLRPGSV